MSEKLVVIFPHQDDESVGTGGTLAAYADQGVATEVVLLTNGDKGRTDWGDSVLREPENDDEKRMLIERRNKEASISLGLLGVSRIETWEDVPTRTLMPNRVSIDRMKTVLVRQQPTVVLGFHEAGTTLHQDHIASALIVYRALTELLQAQLLPGFLRYLTSTLPQAATMLEKYGEIIVPSEDLTSVDVSRYIAQKKQAVYSHESQKHIIEALDRNGVLDIKQEFFLERISRASSTARGSEGFFTGIDFSASHYTIHPMPLHESQYMTSSNAIFSAHLRAMLGG